MNVGELKKALEKYPDHMDVYFDERKTEFVYGLLNSVHSDEIRLSEEPNGETLAHEVVVILSEE